MILRRKVKPFGGSGAHVIVPRNIVGEEAIVVTAEDIVKFENMMFEVLAFRKGAQMDDTEALKKVKALESKLEWLIEELKMRGVFYEIQKEETNKERQNRTNEKPIPEE